jgi:hypothetical protein
MEKASSVKENGIGLFTTTDVRLSHSQKLSSILVTLAGIVIDVMPKCLNDSQAMLVTVSGITVFIHPNIRLFDEVSMIALQLSRESNTGLLLSTVIEVRSRHREKALSMLITLLGIVMDVNPVEPNA